jgi:hypothetical protein
MRDGSLGLRPAARSRTPVPQDRRPQHLANRVVANERDFHGDVDILPCSAGGTRNALGLCGPPAAGRSARPAARVRAASSGNTHGIPLARATVEHDRCEALAARPAHFAAAVPVHLYLTTQAPSRACSDLPVDHNAQNTCAVVSCTTTLIRHPRLLIDDLCRGSAVTLVICLRSTSPSASGLPAGQCVCPIERMLPALVGGSSEPVILSARVGSDTRRRGPRLRSVPASSRDG